jgi:AraC family transcriptional regulator, ethanolamine operon transcriptional activator
LTTAPSGELFAPQHRHIGPEAAIGATSFHGFIVTQEVSYETLESNKASMLRAIFDAVFSDAVAGPHSDRAAAWSVTKQEDLLRILLSCAGNPQSESKSVSSNCERARVMKAALAAINDCPGEILSVGDLCRIARASQRTLHYAFMERFGLSPALYMKVQRLNGARNDLCGEHEPAMNIADVANKWGFWHLGQFAKDYRSWFCELPSATYKRKHGIGAP